MSSSVAAPPAPTAPRDRRPLPGPEPVLLLALVLAVVPFVLGAADVVLHHGGVALGGDQAVLELATREAAEGERSVGAYSRYGWSHPGPLWFYALAPVHRLLGSTSPGLYVAALVVHAVAAAALVAAVGRLLGAGTALAAGIAVATTWAVLGPGVFVAVWNPYALVLPTALLLVLAAGAATGSGTALAAAALTGTFLVQTHVGTAVLVAAVGAAAAAGAVLATARRRTAERRRTGRATLVLWGAVVLAWVPPLVQELRPGTGNLTLLWRFQQGGEHDGQGVSEAAAALAAQLLVLPTAGRATALPEAAAALDPVEVLVLAVALLVPLGLAALALRLRRPVAAALALLSLVALVAALLSATQVEGELYPYLVVWMAVLPLGPLLCAADLLLVALRRAPRPVLLGSGAALAALSLAAVVVVLLGAPPLSADSRYGVAQAAPAVLQALGPDRSGAVRVRIVSSETWPVASGLVLALTRAGYDARVTEDWTFMFGPERAATGGETREVLLAGESARGTVAALPDTRPLPVVTSAAGTTYLVVRDPPGDVPVPVLPGPVTGK